MCKGRFGTTLGRASATQREAGGKFAPRALINSPRPLRACRCAKEAVLILISLRLELTTLLPLYWGSPQQRLTYCEREDTHVALVEGTTPPLHGSAIRAFTPTKDGPTPSCLLRHENRLGLPPGTGYPDHGGDRRPRQPKKERRSEGERTTIYPRCLRCTVGAARGSLNCNDLRICATF
eukprot:384513-Pyramimonas_sp.AAC.1